MTRRPLNVAVTGLNATDNPGPGVGVIRAIRHAPEFSGRIVGLAYDALEPGIYARDLVDDAFMIPYPSQGIEALEDRLRHVNETVGLDVIIPTLDSELPSFIALAPMLRELGVATFLPTRDQFDLRSKAHLLELGERADIRVPRSRVLSDPSQLSELDDEFHGPYVIKGALYGAKVVRAYDEALFAYHHSIAEWGPPIIAQEFIRGEEFDIVAVGDGEGGLIGALPMRKTMLTDKGKGWAGITVMDPKLLEMTERFMKSSRWRGPCEVEVMRTEGGEYYLMEINPRFPAWCFLSAGAGINLPWAVVRLSLGEEVSPMRDYRVGAMFVRITLDQLVELSDFEQITMYGRLSRARGDEK
ncbi:MAG: hypothetical protein AMS19_14625 [Gemmatimonas sp. SG8_23]|nr:MAG: hypothetical protein AMS19_14625 [Gemmatimonas sp. SG8_23]